MVHGLFFVGNNAFLVPLSSAKYNEDATYGLSSVDLSFGLRGLIVTLSALMKTGLKVLSNLCFGRNFWTMGTLPGSILGKFRSCTLSELPTPFASLTSFGCALRYSVPELIATFSGNLLGPQWGCSISFCSWFSFFGTVDPWFLMLFVSQIGINAIYFKKI
jgi:hypothetical protein